MSFKPNQAVPPDRRDPALQTGMFAVLAALLVHAQGAVVREGNMPRAAGLGVGGMPLIEGRELLRTLGRMQVGEATALGFEADAELAPILREAGNVQNVLRRLRGTRLGAGLAPFDATMLELVAMLYDGLFEDPRLSASLKGLVGRLQVAVFKAALADKTLFDGGPHPVRRLVDAIGQLGMRLPRDLSASSALFPVLASTIDELARGNFHDDLEAFDSARVRVEALVASEDARVAAQLRAAEAELEYVETMAASASAREDEGAWPLPPGLGTGSWIAIEERDSRYERHARLHYVTPMKTRFLFVDRRGNKVFEGSRSMLARAFRSGEARLLDSEPDPSLFDRALKRIVAKLRDRPAPEAPMRRRLDHLGSRGRVP